MDCKNVKSLAAVVQNLAMNLLKRKHICDVCLKGFYQKCHLDKHLLIHSGEEEYKCRHSKEQFGKKKHLKQHIKSIHPRRYICDTCHKVFHIKYSLIKHTVVHSVLEPFSCLYCKKTFKHKDYLIRHTKWYCAELREEENTAGRYLAHWSTLDNVKKNKALTCPICQKQLVNPYSLYNHLKSHRGKKRHRCSVCSKMFIQQSYLRRHEKSHSSEKPFSCSKCNNKFKQKVSLDRHMRLHFGEKPFSCTHCSQQFSRKYELNTHLKRTGRVGTYICSICKKLCPTECSLIRHAEIRHNRKVRFNRKHAELHEMIKQFACSTCLKRFLNKTELLKHLKIHENTPIELNENEINVINGIKADLTSRFLVVVCEKLTQSKICELTSYICPICEKLFPTKFLLATHASSHIFEEHWTCSTCYKDFDSKNTLNSHLEIHEVHEMIEQFTCSTCFKRFLNKTKLLKHLKIHENTPIRLNENELNVINGIKADLTSRFLVVVCEKLTQSKICELTSYICPICEKLFPTKFLLAAHASSHIFEEHWACSTCDKDFDSKNTLNSHLEIHLNKETTISPKSEANEDEQPNSKQSSTENEINEHTVRRYFDMDMKQEAEDDLYPLFGTAACNFTDELITKEGVISSI